jgi:UDP-N-acetylmuramate dehydrogenase
LKGKELGGAAVYERQPLILVNKHNAKPNDIIALADLVKQCVYNKFNITLSPEVNYI